MNNILEIKNLSKSYREFSLKDVSFSLPKGYIMGFIGANGAGKTTTIKSILGLTAIDAGEVLLFGQSVGTMPPELKEDIGIVMDQSFYLEEWPVAEVGRILAPFYQRWDHEKFQSLLRRFNIGLEKRVKELSRGMHIKLMLAAALSHGAKLLILDEPTSGLDPVARDELMEILLEFIQNEACSVLFSTHITADLEKTADFITYIQDGAVAFTGTKDDLLERYVLVRGGLSELTPQQKARLIGLREHASGFEGMALTADAGLFPSNFVIEPVSLDEIIIFMNKKGESR